MATQIKKLLQRTADTAAVSFESIGPEGYYTANLDVFMHKLQSLGTFYAIAV
jgi:hypothetical protein